MKNYHTEQAEPQAGGAHCMAEMTETLCASEIRYRRLFEAAKDGILILDAQTGMIMDVNPFLIELLGLSHEDFLGKEVWELGLFKHIVANKAKFAELQARKYVRYDDLPLETADGRQIAVEFVSNVYLEKQKKVIQCNIRDISERKRTQDALSISQQITEGILNAMPIRVFWKDETLTYMGCNSMFAHDAGFAETKDVVGKDDFQMGWRDQAELYRSDDLRVIESGCPKLLIEESQTTPDGKTLTLLMSKIPLRNAQGEIYGVLGTYSDITERKKLEAQFLRVQRMESIGTLAGGIAHDLNNVLAPILMSIAILGYKVTDDEGRELLATLEASAQHGAELVRQVLGFARGIEGQRIHVNPIHILKDIQKMVRDTFPKNINFSVSPSPDLWTVTGDPTQLQQVFTNLCVNARDAMPDGGTLSVTMENILLDDVYAGMNPDAKPGAYVLVKLTDTGIGIPPKILERIFEPFFTTKEIGMGTGMGLSTTLAIVKSHAGFITVYSEKGKGSTFTVYLPANTAAKAADTPHTQNAQFPRGHGECVLLVDDDEQIREIALKTLERFGYRVRLACNGAEAIAAYAQNREEIAIVFTDMAMSVLDGAATLVALRAMNPRIKAIASSGMTLNGGNHQASEAGFKYFLAKPYTAEALLTILAKALREEP